MTKQKEHILDQQLSLWLAGDLTNDLSRAVESHLEACDQCAKRLDELSQPAEPILDRLRDLSHETLIDDKPSERISGNKDSVSFQEIGNPYSDLGVGVLAMESDLINGKQFVEAFSQWNSNRTDSFVDLLLQIDSLSEKQKDAIGDLRTSSNWQELKESDDSRRSELFSNRYKQEMQIKKLHSSGGIGRVWLAEDVTLERDVALKELLPQHVESEEMRKRFIREARITAQLMHPGTVPVHELQDHEGIPSYVMRFVEGKTLTELIAEHHLQLSIDDSSSAAGMLKLLRYFSSVCHTISYAHSQRIIHRDIKSENIIVGDFGEVIVLDWGIAKHLDDNEDEQSDSEANGLHEANEDPKATEYGQRLGTPAFMAPEQALGNIGKIDEQTDVYGLAALLYEILTGQPPYTDEDVETTLHSVIHTLPTLPSHIVKEVPVALEATCMRGLSKRSKARQQSVEELGNEVEDWIAVQLERKQFEKERNHFFAISQDLQAIVDSQGNIIQCNPACERLLGWTYEEMTKMSDADLIHNEQHVEVKGMREQLLATGVPVLGLERKVRHKDGTYRWLSWNVTPMVRESNLYVVGRDITEQKRMQQRFAGLLEIMPDAVVATNIKGKIIVVNQEMVSLFGYQPEEIIGSHIMDIVAERSHEEHLQAIRALVGDRSNWNKKSFYEFFGQRKDGTEFKAEVRHGALESDDELLFVGSIRNVSDFRN